MIISIIVMLGVLWLKGKDNEWLYEDRLLLRIVIVAAYMIAGYRIISDFHERRMEPLFMRLDFFIVPWLLGMICVYGLNIGTNNFFASISLLITYLAYRQRCKFVYRGTDAFAEEFAPHFAAYVEKLGLQGECAFLINAQGDEEAFAQVLDQCRPEKSFLLQRNDGTYMLYTMARRKAVIELLEQTFRDTGDAHVPPVTLTISHHIKDKAESSGDFISRVITSRRKALTEQVQVALTALCQRIISDRKCHTLKSYL